MAQLSNNLSSNWWEDTKENLSTGFGFLSEKETITEYDEDDYNGKFIFKGGTSQKEWEVMSTVFRNIGLNTTTRTKPKIEVRRVKKSESGKTDLITLGDISGVDNDKIDYFYNQMQLMANELVNTKAISDDDAYIINVTTDSVIDDTKFAAKQFKTEAAKSLMQGKLVDNRNLTDDIFNYYTNNDVFDVDKYLQDAQLRESKKDEVLTDKTYEKLNKENLEKALDEAYYLGKKNKASTLDIFLENLRPFYKRSEWKLGDGITASLIRAVKGLTGDKAKDLMAETNNGEDVEKLVELLAKDKYFEWNKTGQFIDGATNIVGDLLEYKAAEMIAKQGVKLAAWLAAEVSSVGFATPAVIAGLAAGAVADVGAAVKWATTIGSVMKANRLRSALSRAKDVGTYVGKALPWVAARGVIFADDAIANFEETMQKYDKGQGTWGQVVGSLWQVGLYSFNVSPASSIFKNAWLGKEILETPLEYMNKAAGRTTWNSIGDSLLTNYFDSVFTVMQGRDVDYGGLVMSGLIDSALIAKNHMAMRGNSIKYGDLTNGINDFIGKTWNDYYEKYAIRKAFDSEELESYQNFNKSPEFKLLQQKDKIESLLKKKKELIEIINDGDNRLPVDVTQAKKDLVKVDRQLGKIYKPFRETNEAKYKEYVEDLDANHLKVLEEKANKQKTLEEKIEKMVKEKMGEDISKEKLEEAKVDIARKERETFSSFATRRLENIKEIGGTKLDDDLKNNIISEITRKDKQIDYEAFNLLDNAQAISEQFYKQIADLQFGKLIPFYDEYKNLTIEERQLLGQLRSYALLQITKSDIIRQNIKDEAGYQKTANEINAILKKNHLKAEAEETNKILQEAFDKEKKLTQEQIDAIEAQQKKLREDGILDMEGMLNEETLKRLGKYDNIIASSSAMIESKTNRERSANKKKYLDATVELNGYIRTALTGLPSYTQAQATEMLKKLKAKQKEIRDMEVELDGAYKIADVSYLEKSIDILEKFLKNVDTFKNKALLDYALKMDNLVITANKSEKKREAEKKKNEERAEEYDYMLKDEKLETLKEMEWEEVKDNQISENAINKIIEHAIKNVEQQEIDKKKKQSQEKQKKEVEAKAPAKPKKGKKGQTKEEEVVQTEPVKEKKPKQAKNMLVEDILNHPELIQSQELAEKTQQLKEEYEKRLEEEKKEKLQEAKEAAGKTKKKGKNQAEQATTETKETDSGKTAKGGKKKKEKKPELTKEVQEFVKEVKDEVKHIKKQIDKAIKSGLKIPELLLNRDIINKISYENLKMLSANLDAYHSSKLRIKEIRSEYNTLRKTETAEHNNAVAKARWERKNAKEAKKNFISKLEDKKGKEFEKSIGKLKNGIKKAEAVLKKEFDKELLNARRLMNITDKELKKQNKAVDKEMKDNIKMHLKKYFQKFVDKYEFLNDASIKKSVLARAYQWESMDSLITEQFIKRRWNLKDILFGGEYQNIIKSLSKDVAKMVDRQKTIAINHSPSDAAKLEHSIVTVNLAKELDDYIAIKNKEMLLYMKKGHYGEADRIQAEVEFRIKNFQKLTTEYNLATDKAQEFFKNQIEFDFENLDFSGLNSITSAALPPDEIIRMLDPSGKLWDKVALFIYPWIQMREKMLTEILDIFQEMEFIAKWHNMEFKDMMAILEAKNELNYYVEWKDGKPWTYKNEIYISNGRIVRMNMEEAHKRPDVEPLSAKHIDLLDKAFAELNDLERTHSVTGGKVSMRTLINRYKAFTLELGMQSQKDAMMLGLPIPELQEFYIPHKYNQILVNVEGEQIGWPKKYDKGLFDFEWLHSDSEFNTNKASAYERWDGVVGKRWDYKTTDDLYKHFSKIIDDTYVHNPAKVFFKHIYDQIPVGKEYDKHRTVIENLLKAYSPEIVERHITDRGISTIINLAYGLTLGLNPAQYLTQKSAMLNYWLYSDKKFTSETNKFLKKYDYLLEKNIPEILATTRNNDENKLLGHKVEKFADWLTRGMLSISGMQKGDKEARKYAVTNSMFNWIEKFWEKQGKNIIINEDNLASALRDSKLRTVDGEIIELSRNDRIRLLKAADSGVSGYSASNIKQNMPHLFNVTGLTKTFTFMNTSPAIEFVLAISKMFRTSGALNIAANIMKLLAFVFVYQQVSNEISSARALADKAMYDRIAKRLFDDSVGTETKYQEYTKQSVLKQIFEWMQTGTIDNVEIAKILAQTAGKNIPLVDQVMFEGTDGLLDKFNVSSVKEFLGKAVKMPGIQGYFKEKDLNQKEFSKLEDSGLYKDVMDYVNNRDIKDIAKTTKQHYNYALRNSPEWLNNGDISTLHTMLSYEYKMQSGETLKKSVRDREKKAITDMLKKMATLNLFEKITNPEAQAELDRLAQAIGSDNRKSVMESIGKKPTNNDDWFLYFGLDGKPKAQQKAILKKRWEDGEIDRKTYESLYNHADTYNNTYINKQQDFGGKKFNF